MRRARKGVTVRTGNVAGTTRIRALAVTRHPSGGWRTGQDRTGQGQTSLYVSELAADGGGTGSASMTTMDDADRRDGSRVGLHTPARRLSVERARECEQGIGIRCRRPA